MMLFWMHEGDAIDRENVHKMIFIFHKRLWSGNVAANAKWNDWLWIVWIESILEKRLFTISSFRFVVGVRSTNLILPFSARFWDSDAPNMFHKKFIKMQPQPISPAILMNQIYIHIFVLIKIRWTLILWGWSSEWNGVPPIIIYDSTQRTHSRLALVFVKTMKRFFTMWNGKSWLDMMGRNRNRCPTNLCSNLWNWKIGARTMRATAAAVEC